MGDLGTMRERDRHGVVRESVDEIGRAVDRVDDPLESAAFARAMDLARFLAEDRVFRKGRAQRRDDRVLGLVVGFGADVAMRFRMGGQALQVARGVDDHRSRAAGGTYGDSEDGIRGHGNAAARW